MSIVSPSAQAIDLTSPKRTIHFGYIDGLRGLAAMYVVMHHFCLWGTSGLPHWANLLFGWTHYGNFAVAVFITLSGFCLMLPVNRSHDKQLRGGFTKYIKRRAWRILPPYYAALICAFLVAILSPQGIAWLQHGYHSDDTIWLTNFTPGNIFSHLFVLHNLKVEWMHCLDMAMWSIATEWQIYFFFPLLLLPVWRWFGNIGAIGIGIAVGMLPHIFLPVTANYDWACPWYLGLFAIGMATATISTTDNWIKAHPHCLPWATLMLCIFHISTKFLDHGIVSVDDDPIRWLKDIITGTIAASVILNCSFAANSGRKNSLLRLFESPIAVGLGTWSYSLYLTHCLILTEMRMIEQMCHLSNVAALILRVFVGIPIALIFAYVFFLIFERPFLKGGNGTAFTFKKQNSKAEIVRNAAFSPAP